jgi:hypothetical protein
MRQTSCCTADELPALRPGTPEYEFSRKAKRSSLLQSLEQQYEPHFSDSDVRLYRKQRELNAARQRPSRRGGFPLDDSLPRPDTFLKLSMEFQRVVCEWLVCAVLLLLLLLVVVVVVAVGSASATQISSAAQVAKHRCRWPQQQQDQHASACRSIAGEYVCFTSLK